MKFQGLLLLSLAACGGGSFESAAESKADHADASEPADVSVPPDAPPSGWDSGTSADSGAPGKPDSGRLASDTGVYDSRPEDSSLPPLPDAPACSPIVTLPDGPFVPWSSCPSSTTCFYSYAEAGFASGNVTVWACPPPDAAECSSYCSGSECAWICCPMGVPESPLSPQGGPVSSPTGGNRMRWPRSATRPWHFYQGGEFTCVGYWFRSVLLGAEVRRMWRLSRPFPNPRSKRGLAMGRSGSPTTQVRTGALRGMRVAPSGSIAPD
jgi:hypothetical protein